jgi:hypothetical protein
MNYLQKGRRYIEGSKLRWKNQPTERNRTDLRAQTLMMIMITDSGLGTKLHNYSYI